MAALRHATLLGDHGAEAHLLGWLAVVSSNRLLLADALAYGERALAAARLSGDDHARAAALDGMKTVRAHLGWVARLRGRHDDAVRYGRQSLDLDSHAWWRAAALAMHATTLIEIGETREAAALLERGLEDYAPHDTQAYRLRCLGPGRPLPGADLTRRAGPSDPRALHAAGWDCEPPDRSPSHPAGV
ncbi:hypothetical protein GCM10010156_05920 [Planobispora rosea]|uniref:Uncharacterized protein n=1 Tax=Planobispora rosea TaxID=35762 RepID=A0A8J3RVK1_PLARO|nr:tetratricopeptide repeat protein [Planobispora rosea]GGS50021.1 hypothetical protein GCM10010156_05920 [Planobispora rosea]GIH83876.1 hypothetical protein Pro02_22840 [Planobispora rosea]